MKTYKCRYWCGVNGESRVRTADIDAADVNEAFHLFLAKQGAYPVAVVVTEPGCEPVHFENHIKDGKIDPAFRRWLYKRWADAKLVILQEALSTQTQTKSYLELLPETRSSMATYLKYLVVALESRGLEHSEIKFIHTWINLKDRSLGETLIAKRIASLPAAERSSSQFGNMMLLGMMASTMRLENALDDMQDEIASIGDEVGEIQEDVGEMHEGFGFEE